MGTEVHCEGYSPADYSMSNLTEDSNNWWSLRYGEKVFTNAQYCNGYTSRTLIDADPGYDKNVLKQKILEHEKTFKNQVLELHRIYRTQKDMMVNLSYARPTLCGTEIVNSSLSSSKVNDYCLAQMQNDRSSKICEVLEVRPSKVRKKLIDLELPADEYIDTDEIEQLRGNDGSFYASSSRANGRDTVIRDSRSSVRLADLNEPAQLEETPSSSAEFLGYGNKCKESRNSNPSAKPNPAFVALPRETTWNSCHTSTNGSLRGLYVDTKSKDRDWFSSTYETGNFKSNLAQSAETFRGYYDKSNYAYKRPYVTSQTASTPYPFTSSSEFTNSWSHTLSSWGKPSGFAIRQSSTIVAKSPESPHTHDSSGNKWHIKSSLRSNLGLATDLSTRKGFYHGSASGSKESPRCFPVTSFDSQKHNKGDNFISDSFSNNGRGKFLVCSDNMASTSKKGFDLNALSQTEEHSRRDLELLDEKREPQDCIPVLPWLKAKPNSPFCPGGPTENLRDISHAQSVTLDIEGTNVSATKELGETKIIRKIMGVPILENPRASKDESSSFISTSATLRSSLDGGNEGRKMMIDINIACDVSVAEPVVAETVVERKANVIRNSFDLNSCITEDEDPFSVESCNNVHLRTTVIEIDLEVAPVLENGQGNFLSEEKDEQNEAPLKLSEHKHEQIAAEAIVAMSSSSQLIFTDENCSDPSDDSLGSLGWLADALFSYENELERKSLERKTKVMDYFEAMTLQLEETKEQEYMPEPFVPEAQTLEDVGPTSLTNRTRRGRGRQRRDFQKDILPGLSSLSRHEVTEDLQTFGELMRATGHSSWSSGLTRRNRGTRGRRRKVIESETSLVTMLTTSISCPPLMQKLSNIESSLEDKRLTGWGKTTRRPRRQRCPAAHPPAL